MNSFDWKNLIDPLFYIHFDVWVKWGFILCYLSFAETGLFAGFFYLVIVYFFWQEFIIEN
jgi:membrane-associated protein